MLLIYLLEVGSWIKQKVIRVLAVNASLKDRCLESIGCFIVRFVVIWHPMSWHNCYTHHPFSFCIQWTLYSCFSFNCIVINILRKPEFLFHTSPWDIWLNQINSCTMQLTCKELCYQWVLRFSISNSWGLCSTNKPTQCNIICKFSTSINILSQF